MNELLRSLAPRGNYSFHIDQSHRSRVKIFAPHGGCIEPCTEPIALAIAMERHDYFVFSGKRTRGCYATLHVTSARYDEPRCLQMAQESEVALALHGCDEADEVVFVGGGNKSLVQDLIAYLANIGFPAKRAPAGMAGEDERNFINHARQKGIQLELSSGFRRSLFPGFPKSSQRNATLFTRFVESIRAWIELIDQQFASHS